MTIYIKDQMTGKVREYGTNQHDALVISDDGTCLTYVNLQVGDGTIEGRPDMSGYLFVTEDGEIPKDINDADEWDYKRYVNIGGFKSEG